MLKMFQSRDGGKCKTKYRGYKKIKITVLFRTSHPIFYPSKLACSGMNISKKLPQRAHDHVLPYLNHPRRDTGLHHEKASKINKATHTAHTQYVFVG